MTNQIKNQSIIQSTDVIQLTLTLKMTTAQVVETSVTVNNNSPIQDHVHPDDQTQPTFEVTPGFKPFTKLNKLQMIRMFKISVVVPRLWGSASCKPSQNVPDDISVMFICADCPLAYYKLHFGPGGLLITYLCYLIPCYLSYLVASITLLLQLFCYLCWCIASVALLSLLLYFSITLSLLLLYYFYYLVTLILCFFYYFVTFDLLLCSLWSCCKKNNKSL